MIREKTIGINVTLEEYEIVRQAAFDAGYNSISSFMYDEVLQPALKERPVFLQAASKIFDTTSKELA